MLRTTQNIRSLQCQTIPLPMLPSSARGRLQDQHPEHVLLAQQAVQVAEPPLLWPP